MVRSGQHRWLHLHYSYFLHLIPVTISQEFCDRSLSMQISTVGNALVRSHVGNLSIIKAYRVLNINRRGRNVLTAAVSPLSVQSEGHRYRLLLEVSIADVAAVAFIIPLIGR